MPIYEYQCASCMKQFALRQAVNVRPGETVCPSCNSKTVERLISQFAAKTYGAADADPSGGTSCSHGGRSGL
jgi:putative FmdB family regulatory protein